jgi:hypothetical protein
LVAGTAWVVRLSAWTGASTSGVVRLVASTAWSVRLTAWATRAVGFFAVAARIRCFATGAGAHAAGAVRLVFAACAFVTCAVVAGGLAASIIVAAGVVRLAFAAWIIAAGRLAAWVWGIVIVWGLCIRFFRLGRFFKCRETDVRDSCCGYPTAHRCSRLTSVI